MNLAAICRKERRGFSLLEVLVALAIFVLLGALVFSLIGGGRALLERQADWKRLSAGIGSALERMEGDLTSALIAGEGRSPLFEVGRFGGNSVWRGFTAIPEEERTAGWGNVYHVEWVEWRIESGGLVREARRDWVGGDREKKERWEGIRLLRLAAWDPKGEEWVEVWGGERDGTIPPAVRVTVGNGVREWSVVVAIPVGFGGGVRGSIR